MLHPIEMNMLNALIGQGTGFGHGWRNGGEAEDAPTIGQKRSRGVREWVGEFCSGVEGHHSFGKRIQSGDGQTFRIAFRVAA